MYRMCCVYDVFPNHIEKSIIKVSKCYIFLWLYNKRACAIKMLFIMCISITTLPSPAKYILLLCILSMQTGTLCISTSCRLTEAILNFPSSCFCIKTALQLVMNHLGSSIGPKHILRQSYSDLHKQRSRSPKRQKASYKRSWQDVDKCVS